MTDEELVKKLQAHDEDALEALIELYGDFIRQVVWRYLRGEYQRGYTLDIENRSYYQVWAKIDRYDPAKGNFPAWLGTVVKHQTLDYKKGLAATFQNLDLLPDAIASTEPLTPPDWSELFTVLNEQEQQIFNLFFVEGLYPAEIAKQLKLKPATVYQNLSRGRRKIQKGGFADVDFHESLH